MKCELPNLKVHCLTGFQKYISSSNFENEARFNSCKQLAHNTDVNGMREPHKITIKHASRGPGHQDIHTFLPSGAPGFKDLGPGVHQGRHGRSEHDQLQTKRGTRWLDVCIQSTELLASSVPEKSHTVIPQLVVRRPICRKTRPFHFL